MQAVSHCQYSSPPEHCLSFLPIDSHLLEYKCPANQSWPSGYQHSYDVLLVWHVGLLSVSTPPYMKQITLVVLLQSSVLLDNLGSGIVLCIMSSVCRTCRPRTKSWTCRPGLQSDWTSVARAGISSIHGGPTPQPRPEWIGRQGLSARHQRTTPKVHASMGQTFFSGMSGTYTILDKWFWCSGLYVYTRVIWQSQASVSQGSHFVNATSIHSLCIPSFFILLHLFTQIFPMKIFQCFYAVEISKRTTHLYTEHLLAMSLLAALHTGLQCKQLKHMNSLVYIGKNLV